jgi:hypothetical protein
MRARLVSTSMVALWAGCGVPLAQVALTPVPVAGQGEPPVKAQVRRAGVSDDLLSANANLEPSSRIAFEIDLFNADPQRAWAVGAPRLALRDALGGPETIARPWFAGADGLPGRIWGRDAAEKPPRYLLGPGQRRTIWVAYGGFPPDGPRNPVRATIQVDVEGAAPLELAVVDPVPGGPRWGLPRRPWAAYLGGALSAIADDNTNTSALAPFCLDVMWAQDRLVWGIGGRFEWLERDAFAGGPPAFGVSPILTVGWMPWRLPLGVYATLGEFFGEQSAPAAYAALDRSSGHGLLLPRAGAGLLLGAGRRLASSGPLPIERPMSVLRRAFFRLGYEQWFELGSPAGRGSIQLLIEAAVGP